MKPYYSHAGITIFHGDCREYFDQQKRARAQREAMRMASKSPSSDDVMSLLGLADWESEVIDFDLCLTDPPYGIDYMHAGGRNPKNGWNQFEGPLDWDKERASKESIKASLAAAKKSIIWGGNYFTDSLAPSSRWLVWDKMQEDFSLADCELAWCSWDGALRRLNYSRGAANQEVKQHPTQKPVALMKWCLSFAPDAKTVIDPFMGSGSVLVAAKHRGLTAVGIDMEERYCEIAARRLSQEVFDFG